MESTYSKSQTLPYEILHTIFQHIVEERPRVRCFDLALVCKSWSLPAQTALYSQIRITRMSQLRKFYNTVKHNIHLGSMVKALESSVTTTERLVKIIAEVSTLLPALLTTLLPNVQQLGGGDLINYTPVLKALKKSKLTHLNRLDTPFKFSLEKKEILNYITCVSMIKSRIENVQISDTYYTPDGAVDGQLTFDSLYNVLDDFKKLKHIKISKNTHNGIPVLEYILETCKSLEKISFRFTPQNHQISNNDVSADDISNFVQRPNISLIYSNDLKLSINCNYLLYIMHTFPQLRSLHLLINKSSIVANQDILAKLLDYIVDIDKYLIQDLKIDTDTAAKVFYDHWKVTSMSGSNTIMFNHKRTTQGKTTSIRLWKGRNSKTIHFFHRALNIEFISDFIKINGKSLCKIDINTGDTLSKDFFFELFTHCPDLHTLALHGCTLRELSESPVDFDNRFSLDVLSLNESTLYKGTLNRLSSHLAKARELHICNIDYRSDEDSFEIAMPNTAIDSIIFKEIHIYNPLYLHVFATTHDRHYYYRYNPSSAIILDTSNEVEFLEINDIQHVYVSCLEKPDFYFPKAGPPEKCSLDVFSRLDLGV